MEDILLMYNHLDKTVMNMPTFVATKLKRLPSSSPSEVNVCALAANVNELQTQMEAMSEAIKKLVKGQTDMVAAVESTCGNKTTAVTTTTRTLHDHHWCGRGCQHITSAAGTPTYKVMGRACLIFGYRKSSWFPNCYPQT